MFYSVSAKEWRDESHDKEHTVHLGPNGNWHATVVVVPTKTVMVKNEHTGQIEEHTYFTEAGVRVEFTELRQTQYAEIDGQMAGFTLPGQSLFYKFPIKARPAAKGRPARPATEAMISETMPGMIAQYPTGKPKLGDDGLPFVVSTRKLPGVRPEKHRLGKVVLAAVAKAQASYEAYKESQRG